jgi:nucleolar protein 56
MYLITRWFGTFLCNKSGIKKKKLFSKNKKVISENLIKIDKMEILNQEKQITKGVKNIIVSEKRLSGIGNYKPLDPFFLDFEINPEDFNYSKNLLQEATLIVTKSKIKKKLAKDDLQIIQMINTLDDLIQTSNLLSERMNCWSVIPKSNKRIEPLKNTILTVDNEIKSLEKQINHDVKNIAPNTCQIIGPLITARLISIAGGTESLAKMPASTIQILGAEKALFRYKKEGGKPPKHGVIFQHSMINKAPRQIRGKISRLLSTKISLSIKADVFTKRDISKNLKLELDKQLKEIKN